MKRVPLLDYAFLAFESESSPKHVAGLQIFNLPKNAPKDFVRNLVSEVKSVPATAPFNQRLLSPLIGLPSWEEDPYFDMDEHVYYEKLPPPHSEKVLLERVAELHADKLDRIGPLWRLYLIDGYQRHSFALFFKIHHAYMDGISLSKRTMSSLSDSPDQESVVSFWGEGSPDHHKEATGIASYLMGSAKLATKAMFVLPVLAKLGLKHGLRLTRLSGRELPLPFTAPRTAFNAPLTAERSVAITRFSLSRIRSIAKHAAVTINDVVLELCDSAMTRYLAEHENSPKKPLVAQMPISLRQSEKGRGNQISIALLELSSKEKNPVARLQRIHSHAQHAKDEFADMSSGAAEVYTLLLQGIAQFGESSGLGRFIPPLGNVVVSNVVGPPNKLYLSGAPLRAIYPISTIAPGLALNITTYSYNNSLFLGIVAGKKAIGDLGYLVEYLDEALLELEKAMGLRKKKKASGETGKRSRKNTRSAK